MDRVEMVISSAHMPLIGYKKRIVLKEKNGDRQIAIWIDPIDAETISAGLKNIKSTRLHTYDFICTVITGLGAALEHVVYDTADEGLGAVVVIKKGKQSLQIGCTPLDAISIALKAGVPVFATEELLKKMGT